MASDRQERFEAIFAGHEWGGDSRSGPGSDPESTRPYVTFLDEWLAAHPDVTTIVEAGCGDWATTRLVNLEGRRYVGIDIVEEMIAQNNTRYGSDSVSFVRADFVDDTIPQGDVLISKDVLQHLSNASIERALAGWTRAFRYLILVNDVKKVRRTRRWKITRRTEIDKPNRDIADGESRPLRLRDAPFGLPAETSVTYRTYIPFRGGVMEYDKEILVCRTDAVGG